MPTPSKHQPNSGMTIEEWSARPSQPPRSIFGNYRPKAGKSAEAALLSQDKAEQPGLSLQGAIDSAIARSWLYRFLAQSFEDPTEESWTRLSATDCRQVLESGVLTLALKVPAIREAAQTLQSHLKQEAFEAFQRDYQAAFGHAARGRCPLNEIEYGDIKADPLFQPHRLADLAAFYRAFGLELAPDAHERHDHISLELEFMCVLAAKEAYALEHQLDSQDLSLCRDAQRRFLRDHLGRWAPAFTRRLRRLVGESPLAALADLTRVFVEAECARFGITAGSDDLLLRPVDETAESLCASCGFNQLPPGALLPTQP